MKKILEIQNLVKKHEEWRTNECLNLIASENILSELVRSAYLSDLMHRYGDYNGRDLEFRKYQGTKHICELEKIAEQVACDLFHAKFVELRAISGHIAGVAAILGLVKNGDYVMELGSDTGGHRVAEKFSGSPLIDIEVEFIPFDYEKYNIDISKCINKMQELQPRLIILGASNFLFPHPIKEICKEAKSLDTIVAYDGSHVFGLIAGGVFQDPIKEGAHLVMGSTHKTLGGPQGGILLTNDEKIATKVSKAIYPALITNHHLHRIPALAIALLEMQTFGKEYANQIVENAQRLGGEISKLGVPVVGAKQNFTQSHTILLQVNRFGKGEEIAFNLEQANIITNPTRLPEELGSEGIRIGVQEMTRLGMEEQHMPRLAKYIVSIIKDPEQSTKIRKDVKIFRKQFNKLHFVFPYTRGD